MHTPQQKPDMEKQRPALQRQFKILRFNLGFLTKVRIDKSCPAKVVLKGVMTVNEMLLT